MFGITKKVKLKLFQIKWRKLNKHNFILPTTIFDSDLVKIGIGTYGYIDIIPFGSKDEKLIIGNYCSISENVRFILGGEHNFNNVTTFPFSNLYLKQKTDNITKGPIVIGHDVWIGVGTTVLSGVKIGNGSVIGAYSVVRRNVPPYAIAVGNPLKIVGFRFTQEIMQALETMNPYENLSLSNILKNINLFEERPSQEMLDEISDLIKSAKR
jgi:acetyltransferase-like isoleucine patch superfamily enzyme